MWRLPTLYPGGGKGEGTSAGLINMFIMFLGHEKKSVVPLLVFMCVYKSIQGSTLLTHKND